MELLGLTFAQVGAILGVAGAAVIALYLLKLRRRPVAVPFVKLWEQVLAEKQTTRLFARLKRILSLLIALTIVALLAFALGDPRYAGATAAGRTLVLLLDASASMKATDVASNRLDQAKQEARRLVDGLGPADRMLIAQMDATTTPMSPLTSESRVLMDAIAAVAPTDVTADFRAGAHFALDVLRGQPRPELVVISDGRFEGTGELTNLRAAKVRLSYVRVGSSDRNVAISAFAVRRYPLDKSQSEVLVELWNPSAQDHAVELTLLGDGQPVDVQRLSVRKGERLRRFFRNVSGVDRTLEARLRLADGTSDDLPADDRAYARLPERRRARVLAVSNGNLYLSAALLLDEYLDVTEVSTEQYATHRGRYDVIVFDGWSPPEAPTTNAIYIHPEAQGAGFVPATITGTIERPFFDRVDRRHPLLRWTALHDVNIADALLVRPNEGDQVIASDRRGPLILARGNEGRRTVVFTFDIRRSDLPLRIAWPLLLLNTINWFIEEDAGYVSSYRTGDTWHVPVPAGVQQATIVDPHGRKREVPVVDGRAVLAGTEAGLYKVLTPRGNDVFAANLGPGEESRIEPVRDLTVATIRAQPVSASRAGVRREIWLYLVFGALAVLAVEWFTYHRRWTV